MCNVFGGQRGQAVVVWLADVGGNVFVRLAAGSRWFDFLVNCLLMFSLAAHGVAAAWLWWLFCGCVLCENSIVCRCTN